MDSRGGPQVVVVPGLGVRSYAEPPVAEVRATGYDVELRPAPAWHGVPDDIARYGRGLAEDLQRRGEPVAVLVGLSVGTQAAAVAAAATPLVQRLVLVSPTIDPTLRTMIKSIRAWIQGDPRDESTMMPQQLLDWARAGPRRLLSGFGSAIDLHLEDTLPTVSAELILVHAEFDPLTSNAYAARLAADHGGRAHGARPDFLGLDTKKFPHDIGLLGPYGPVLDRLDRARRLWSALPVADALTGLAAAGLSVEEEGPAARTDGGT